MTRRSIDHLWVHPSVDFLYLTGIDALSFERVTGLLVRADGRHRAVVPLMLREELEPLDEVAEARTWADAEGPAVAVAAALGDVTELHVLGSLPMWAAEVLRSAQPHLEVKVDPGTVAGLRELKDEDELAALHASAAITDDVVEWIATLDLDALTEKQLSGRIQARYLELGYRPGDWALIATGAKASMPHYAGGDVPIAMDAPLLADFGGVVDNYWSDTTRIYFPGEVDGEVGEAYAAICAAYDAALARARPGVTCQDVDRAARAVIADAGFGDNFLHRTGHGVGLEVHEDPYIREGNEQQLEPGHVFTIAPGIYVAGRFGLRYENVVWVGEKGAEALNSTPREHFL